MNTPPLSAPYASIPSSLLEPSGGSPASKSCFELALERLIRAGVGGAVQQLVLATLHRRGPMSPSEIMKECHFRSVANTQLPVLLAKRMVACYRVPGRGGSRLRYKVTQKAITAITGIES